MSYPPGINNQPVTPNVFSPETLLGELQDVRETAVKSLQTSFKLLGTLISGGAIQGNGLQQLEAPSAKLNANDVSLRIGLLQDALNQLMQQVSKLEIKQRMTEMQKENQQQLDKFEEQMRKAAEAAEKNKEAHKKGNIFEAISNWIQAVVSIVSAVFTLITAAAEVFTNPVGAAGLIVAGVALIGAAAVQITLAVDATLQAAGQDGFLSEDQKAQMKKAAEILGYIAIVGSMIGLVGGVVVALGQAGRAATSVIGEQVGRAAAAQMVKDVTVEVARGSANMSLSRAAYYAFKETMDPLFKLGARLAVTQALGQSANAVSTGVGKLKVADLQQEASDLKAQADRAEAAQKAIQAQINKLNALIEQLKQELEQLVDQCLQILSIIFGAIDKSAQSMTLIHQASSV